MELKLINGIYHVGYHTSEGKKWKSTRSSTKADAMEVCRAAKIREIEIAAKSGALTADIIASITANKSIACKEALKEWVDWRSRTKAHNTAQSQAYTVSQFLLGAERIDGLVNEITSEDINDFVNGAGPQSRATRQNRLKAVKAFTQFALSRGWIIGDPAIIVKVNHRLLSHNQKTRCPSPPFTEEEFRIICQHMKGFWRTATILAYWTGLRLCDVAGLEWASFNGSELNVWTTKKDVLVAIPLSSPYCGNGIVIELLNSLERRHPRFVFPEKAELVTTKQAILSMQYSRALKSVGINGRSFHGLRRTFIQRLNAGGVHIKTIGRIVAHESPSTTEIYL